MKDGKQIRNGTITAAKLSLTTPVNPNDPATKQFTEDLITTSGYLQNWKKPVRVFSSTNINLAAPGANIDGVAMSINDTFLAGGQTTASQVGSYTWLGASTPATRTPDFDSSAEAIDGSVWAIQQGTSAGKYKKLITDAPIILGTTALVLDDFLATSPSSNPIVSNKFMVASVTSVDGDLACVTGMSSTPNNGGFVRVSVNGDEPEIGDAVKTKDCYFSGDLGVTARAFNAVASADKLYWNGSIAGYQLSTTDRISFDFNV